MKNLANKILDLILMVLTVGKSMIKLIISGSIKIRTRGLIHTAGIVSQLLNIFSLKCL